MAAGGLGPVMSASSHPPSDLGSVLAKGLVSVVGFWSTLGLNSPDFSRFAKSQRDQMVGQALGLPTTMVAFSILGVLTSSAMAVIYGKVIWNPLDIIAKMPPGMLTAVALIGILIATVCVNVPANLVSPAYDLSNLAPRHITFWRGALITAALATAIMPWRLLATAGSYLFGWLGTYGDLLGPIAGILIVDFWIVRQKTLIVDDLYRTEGAYRYVGGFNLIAIFALAVGIGAAIIGRAVPALQMLSDFGWFTGLLVGGAVYGGLMALVYGPQTATNER
jgi:NCS1 family nucleobase:cation symporter-1